MIRLLAAVLVATFASAGEAGVLRCSFTEPFFTITWDASSGRVVRRSSDDLDSRGHPVPRVLAKKATLQPSTGAAKSSVWILASDSQTLLELTLDGSGSDGMSDALFPFRARYREQEGACDTTDYPRWDFDDLLIRLRASR